MTGVWVRAAVLRSFRAIQSRRGRWLPRRTEYRMDGLDGWPFGAATALAFSLLLTACAPAFALSPAAPFDFFNNWFHGPGRTTALCVGEASMTGANRTRST